MKHAKKKVRGFFNRTLALVLAMTLMLSVFCISAVSVGAKADNLWFGEGTYIYVSIKDAQDIRNYMNDKIKCHMYKDWPGNSGSYVDSIDMQRIGDTNYYRCFLLADNIKYLKFMLNNDGNWWIKKNGNPVFSLFKDDKDNNPCNGENCLYILNKDANDCSWGSIVNNDPYYSLPTTKSQSYTKTATNAGSMLSSNLTRVKGTFYDYYNNTEMKNGWISGQDGSERTYKNREPFSFFNRAIADYSRSNTNWAYPLYFGDFNRSGTGDGGPGPWYDGYKGSGVSNLNKYNARANNSNMTSSGVNGAVAGLVDQNLKGGATGSPTANGVELPYFSSSFLGQGNGTIINSQFAFRQETRNSDTYYVYDSQDGKDNFYFTNRTSNTPVANYSKNSNSITDAAAGFGNSSNGKGFFPFDQPDSDAKDFGFGMKLEIPFTLNQNGKTENGNNVVFNFSGDDDLWVFIDGKLILDMGGAHKKAQGSIDFTNKSVTVNSLDTNLDTDYYTTTANNIKSVAWGAAHTMTVFYMERGMIESNLKIEYNFTPLDNLLTTEKVVDTTDVNAGLADAVKSVDSFTITNKDTTKNTALANKSYTLTSSKSSAKKTSDSNGSYTIKDSEKADFINVVSSDQTVSGPKVGDTLSVTETFANTKLKYSTKYSVTDIANNKEITALTTGTSAAFAFKNSVTQNVDDYAAYNVKFVNTPEVSDLSVSKKALDKNGNELTNRSFDFTVKLDVGTGSYSTYNLVYDVVKNGVTIKSGATATDGVFSLNSGEKAVFKNIPVNTKYQIEETTDSDFTTKVNGASGNEAEGTVTSTATTVSYVNTQIDKSGPSVDITAKKLLDGATPTADDKFQFTLTEKQISGGKLINKEGGTQQTAKNSADKIKFSIKYDYVDPGQPTQPTTAKPQPTTAKPQPTTAKPQPTTAPSKMLYLVPNSNWKKDNARFAMYLWDKNNTKNIWVSMSSADGTTYSAQIPDGDWAYVIFCRMNPGTSTNNWDNKWNQTGDIAIPSSNNCYTVNEGAWDKGGGSWSTKSTKSSGSVGANIEPAEEVGAIADDEIGATANTMKYIYEIAEKNLGGTRYSYDNAKFYVAVTIDVSVSPNKVVSTKYYETEEDVINDTNPLADPSKAVFKNYHKGSITVNKTNESGEDLSNTEFALVKVESDGLLDNNQVMDKVLKDIDDNINAHYKLGVTEDGKVVFDNLVIFQDGTGMYTANGWSSTAGTTDEFTSQVYCLFEYKPTEGYHPSYVKQYFTLPVENKFNVTFDYVDGAVVMPNSSGEGTNMWIFVGTGILLTGALLFTSYSVYNLRSRKKRRARASRYK